jgi:predicted TIM-barrel fold metal-dependent hydrolase
MIVDGHCHAGRGDGLTSPWDTEAPLAPYLRRARLAGIDRTVVVAAGNRDYGRANRELAAIVARHPGRLVGFACVHPRRDAGRVRDMVGEAVTRWSFRGVKVHRLDAPVTREVCEAARGFGVPVVYDVVGAVHLLDLLVPQYPEVDFVIPHLGSFADDWRAHERLIEQLVRYPNLYGDTSGVRRFDYLVRAVRRAGPGKLVFGSDGPWLHPALELAKVRLLGLPPAEEAMVLGGNLLRLLRRSRPGAGAGRAARWPPPAARAGSLQPARSAER